MGGVDDDEPPAKRVKTSSAESRSLSNSFSLKLPVDCSKATMARPVQCQEKEDIIGSKGVIKRVEFVRIITKALYSLGYERSGAILEEESRIPLYSSVVNLFRKQVLDGNWDEGLSMLDKIGFVDKNLWSSAAFLILEQKYVELLQKDQIMAALNTLKSEITPLAIDEKRVHDLASCLIYPSRLVLLGFSDIGTEDAKSRLKLLDELQKFLPPTVMIPERRLENLVEQALCLQKESCIFHNASDSSLSLYTDHDCGKEQLPFYTTQILEGHDDEVWFLQFSNNGKYLASSSIDKSAIIWEIHEDGPLSLKHKLIGHQEAVALVAWSPDDSQLLTCGTEEVVRRWDVISGQCLGVYEKPGFGLTSCGWLPDGKQVFAGVTDRSICIWDLEGKEIDSWKGQRSCIMSDVLVTKDGRLIISVYEENVIMLLDYHKETNMERLIEEEQTITSFTLSQDNNFLLVNLLNQEIHLWSIKDGPRLLNKYKGHKRSRFLIRSCFGGVEQGFIASGSEDSQVYIWHRSSGKLVGSLPGHSGAVNGVSWNPSNPHMLASASDDKTIRIWGLRSEAASSGLKPNKEETYSNGARQCNTNTK